MKVTLFRDLPTEHWYSMDRYADELARMLPKLGCDVESFVAARPFPELSGAANALANYAWRMIVYPRHARKRQSEINHIIDHSYAHLLHALDASRTVVTCHDIAPLARNEGRGIGRRLWDQSFRAMLRTAHVIADSAFTREAIISHSDYPADRIHVVPLAASGSFFESIKPSDLRALREEYQLTSRRIILHVGSCEPRKNVEAILFALEALDHDIALVQIGGTFSPSQRALIESLDLGDRVLQISFAEEEKLRTWYQSADVFVFPSHYEGFGLPVLEAMASGAPVVCANAGSLPEIAEDAALLTYPNEADKLSEAIRGVLQDSALAADLRVRGIERAKKFSWERVARETLAIYHEIAKR